MRCTTVQEIDISLPLITISRVDDTEYLANKRSASCRVRQNEIKYPVRLKDAAK